MSSREASRAGLPTAGYRETGGMGATLRDVSDGVKGLGSDWSPRGTNLNKECPRKTTKPISECVSLAGVQLGWPVLSQGTSHRCGALDGRP